LQSYHKHNSFEKAFVLHDYKNVEKYWLKNQREQNWDNDQIQAVTKTKQNENQGNFIIHTLEFSSAIPYHLSIVIFFGHQHWFFNLSRTMAPTRNLSFNLSFSSPTSLDSQLTTKLEQFILSKSTLDRKLDRCV